MNNLNNALSISNIAWDPELDNKVGAICKNKKLNSLMSPPVNILKIFTKLLIQRLSLLRRNGHDLE